MALSHKVTLSSRTPPEPVPRLDLGNRRSKLVRVDRPMSCNVFHHAQDDFPDLVTAKPIRLDESTNVDVTGPRQARELRLRRNAAAHFGDRFAPVVELPNCTQDPLVIPRGRGDHAATMPAASSRLRAAECRKRVSFMPTGLCGSEPQSPKGPPGCSPSIVRRRCRPAGLPRPRRRGSPSACPRADRGGGSRAG